MVDFDLQRYRKGSRLMLSKRDIETIADAVLQDFKPPSLKRSDCFECRRIFRAVFRLSSSIRKFIKQRFNIGNGGL